MLAETAFRFSITDEQFRYLAIQQGGINDLAVDRDAWEAAYHASMQETYQTIRPFLPRAASRIMDIGSGLGGIDAVLNRHYGGHIEIVPIDGATDAPVMTLHAQTFNSERVTREFLRANGVNRVAYYSPDALPMPSRFPLIVSFASWCFHYPPGRYLTFVKACLAPGGKLIIDVRRDKPKWREILDQTFKPVVRAHQGKKYDRMVYSG